MGFPWVDEVTSLTYKFPNFFVDTSAYVTHRLPAAFVEYMRGAGAGRVMFGTNWPMISHEACLRGLDGLGLSDAQKSDYLYDTAARVFGLP